MSWKRKIVDRSMMGDDVILPIDQRIAALGFRRVYRRASLDLANGKVSAAASYLHPDGSRLVIRLRRRAAP